MLNLLAFFSFLFILGPFRPVLYQHDADSLGLVVRQKRSLQQRPQPIKLFSLKYAIACGCKWPIIYSPYFIHSQMPGPSSNSSLGRRRGSDRSLSGSAHELAVCGINKDPTKVPHSHSQSNLSEIPYR